MAGAGEKCDFRKEQLPRDALDLRAMIDNNKKVSLITLQPPQMPKSHRHGHFVHC
jgi:hypothetical protein